MGCDTFTIVMQITSKLKNILIQNLYKSYDQPRKSLYQDQ